MITPDQLTQMLSDNDILPVSPAVGLSRFLKNLDDVQSCVLVGDPDPSIPPLIADVYKGVCEDEGVKEVAPIKNHFAAAAAPPSLENNLDAKVDLSLNTGMKA